MAKKKLKNEAEDLLLSLGVRGQLTDLVRKAIIQGWDMDEFSSHLIQTRAFRKRFPGLIDFKTGQLQVDFTGGAGFSAQNLLTAVGRYRAGYDDFQAAARRVGYGNPSRKVFALAVRSDQSIEEFTKRLSAIQSVKANPELMDSYNEQLKLAGKKPFDKKQWYRFVAGASDPEFYDVYEAARLRTAGMDFTAQEARQVAGGISSGTDITKLIAEVQRVRTDIAPELKAQGITDADIVLLGAGSDPKGIAGKLEQITNQRRARTGPGTYAKESSTGGYSIYPEDEAGY
jgi:hypothetical protein